MVSPPSHSFGQLVDGEAAAYTLEQCATMFLDAECRVVNDPYRDERLLWKEAAQGGYI